MMSSPGSAATTNASALTSGTLPDGRFPATLPAASGVNLTALNASNLGSGTIPDARFPATLPAASGANLTGINAANVSGPGTFTTLKHTAAFVDGSVAFASGSSGGSITLADAVCRTVIDASGTLTTFTVTMPASPVDGQIVSFSTDQIITSLTVSANAGQTIKGAIGSLALGGRGVYVYRLSNTTWYPG